MTHNYVRYIEEAGDVKGTGKYSFLAIIRNLTYVPIGLIFSKNGKFLSISNT